MWFKNFTPPKFKGSPFPGGHFQVPCWTSWCSLKYFCPNAGLPVPQFPQDTRVARPGSRFFLGAIWQWPMACGSHEQKAAWRDSKRGGEKSTQLDHNWCMRISWIVGQFCFDLRDEPYHTNRICFMYECSPMRKLTLVGYRGSFYIDFISCQQKILTLVMEEVLHQLVRNCNLSHYLQGYKIWYISGDVEFQPSIVPR